MHDTVFTTIAGSLAYVAKVERYRVSLPEYGCNLDLRDHSAVQGSFRFEG